MKERRSKPRRSDVRGVVEELGELVEDLGLVEPTAVPPAPADAAADAPAEERPSLAAPPPPSAPVWRSGPEVRTGSGAAAPPPVEEDEPTPIEAVPMWESATDTEETEPAAAASPLWETFSQELSAAPPRPWSPAAAMVVLEPLGPPEVPHVAPPSNYVSPWQRRPHVFTIVTAVAVAIALAVLIFSRLDLGRTSGPPKPVLSAPFSVTMLRTVDATSAAQVPKAKSVQSFPAGAAAIYIDVVYSNVGAGDALQIVILLKPQLDTQPAVTVSDETHRNLDPNGEIAVSVAAPPGGFTPGSYEVRAIHDGTLEKSATFQVEQ